MIAHGPAHGPRTRRDACTATVLILGTSSDSLHLRDTIRSAQPRAAIHELPITAICRTRGACRSRNARVRSDVCLVGMTKSPRRALWSARWRGVQPVVNKAGREKAEGLAKRPIRRCTARGGSAAFETYHDARLVPHTLFLFVAHDHLPLLGSQLS